MAKKSVSRKMAGAQKLPLDIRFSMKLRKELDSRLRDLEEELNKTFQLHPGITNELAKRWRKVRKVASVVAYGGGC